jgi:carbamoyltransferase
MLTDNPDVSIVIDGFGDLDKAWSVFKGEQFIAEGSQKLNGSIGVSMAEAGKLLGVNFGHVSDIAGKVMGLQSYGNVDKEYLTQLKQYNMFSINEVFSFDNWKTYKQDELIANHTKLDWIATVHERVGNILVDFFHQYCKKDDVVFYSGGVAQNVIWNTKLLKEFPNLVVPPHSTDEGLSLGALEWLRIKNNLPKFTLQNFPFVQSDTAPEDEPCLDLIKEVARLLSIGKTVAWYQGHGEVGPRALGNRSILMNPNLEKIKINAIKRRENYRPFGASILREHMRDYFIDDIDNPHMLFVSDLIEVGLDAIRHVDNTCRVQTVDNNGSAFRILLEEFYKITGCPVLLNTSLNLAGKPIAGHMESAEELFRDSELDCLAIGNGIYLKVDDETKMG